MYTPTTSALAVLASLCFDSVLGYGEYDSRYEDACPAYEHYARFAQYVKEPRPGPNGNAYGDHKLMSQQPPV